MVLGQGRSGGHFRPLRLRQEHPSARPGRPSGAQERQSQRLRAGPGATERVRPGSFPGQAHRVHLPGLQPASGLYRRGKRVAGNDVFASKARPAPRPGIADEGRAVAPRQAPALRDVHRRAATRGHRAGPCGQAGTDPGRRAHRLVGPVSRPRGREVARRGLPRARLLAGRRQPRSGRGGRLRFQRGVHGTQPSVFHGRRPPEAPHETLADRIEEPSPAQPFDGLCGGEHRPGRVAADRRHLPAGAGA